MTAARAPFPGGSAPGYRPEIDGLRALAVLPVILFHASVPGFGGGFVGVDVFFVISGYLITSICLREIRAGTFSLAGFYERRARRILPALFLVVTASIPAALWLMTPGELQDFSESVFAVVLFASNFHFIGETGYFATAADLKPLLHTWSLAVEEQYYLFAPLLLVLLTRRRGIWPVLGTAVLALASLGIAEWAWRNLPDANFFITPSRIWELMLGALAAFALIDGDRVARIGGGVAQATAALGIGMILWAVFRFDDSLPFPSLHALVPTVGTVLVILFTRPGTFVAGALSARAVVAIGLVSYSAYLWHQPLLAFARIGNGGVLDPAATAALIVATFLLAYLSWRFVELPFRDRTWLTRRRVFALAGAGSLALVAAGLAGTLGRGLPQRYAEPELSFFRSLEELSSFRIGCRVQAIARPLADEPCQVGDADVAPTMMVWGDSHAEVLTSGLGSVLAPRGESAVMFDKGGCAPLAGTLTSATGRATRDCAEQNQAALSYLRDTPAITTVVLVARWDFHAGTGTFEPGIDLPAGAACRPTSAHASFRDGVEATACLLKNLGKRVVVLRQVPKLSFDPFNRLYDRRAGAVDLGIVEYPLRHADYLDQPGDRALDAIAGVTIVDPYGVLCDAPRAVCRVGSGGIPLYRDADHLSTRGAALVAEELVRSIGD